MWISELHFYGSILRAKLTPWSMVVEMVPVKGGIGGIVHPPIGRKNATYIPLIYCLLGGKTLPTTFCGKQKQPLTWYLILKLVPLHLIVTYSIFRYNPLVFIEWHPSSALWTEISATQKRWEFAVPLFFEWLSVWALKFSDLGVVEGRPGTVNGSVEGIVDIGLKINSGEEQAVVNPKKNGA